jgi:hypothetical protein
MRCALARQRSWTSEDSQRLEPFKSRRGAPNGLSNGDESEEA